MKPLKIIDYSLIVLSMLYSTYVTFMFLGEYTSFLTAILLSLFLVYLGHHYTYQTVENFIKNKRLNQYAVLAVVLMGLVFYAEWNGQFVHAKKATVIPTTEAIDKQIVLVQQTINESSKHTVRGKTNWAKYQTFIDSQKQLNRLEESRKEQLMLIDEKLSEAEGVANQFRAFSIVLFLLAFLASSVHFKKSDSVELEVSANEESSPIDGNKLKIIDLIRDGEIQGVQMLVDYFNIKEKEAKYLFSKFAPKSNIGF